MDWRALIGALRARLGLRREQDMREDMAFHLEMSTEAFRKAGHSPVEARRLARVKFGGVDRYEEAARDAMGGRRLADLAADLRFGVRAIVRAPAFSLVAIGSLALGIGASATMLSIVDAVLLRPLPYPASDRLVQMMVRNGTDERDVSLSLLDAYAIRDGTRAFSALGVVYPEYAGFSLVAGDRAEQLRGSWVSAGALQALGVAPLIGPGVRPQDEVTGATPVVLLSERLWRDRFAGSTGVIGQTIRVQGESRTIVGVMPSAFRLPGFSEEDLWLVPRFEPPTWRAPFFLRLVGRLAPERTLEQARAELAPIAERVAAEFPGADAEWQYTVTPLHDVVVRDATATIWMLTGAVALVMIIAIANVATLLVVRTTSRVSELAVRVALGAGRGRIARQLVTESVLLALMGGAIGLLIGVAALGILIQTGTEVLPRLHEVGLTGRVLLLTLGLSVVSGIVVGLAPLTRMSTASADWLRSGERTGADTAGGRRLREAFVVAELALALTIVIGAGLLLSSLQRLQAVNPGSITEGVLAVRLSLPEAEYPESERVLAFYEALEERIARLPGVEAAAVSMAVPPSRLVMRNPARPAGPVTAGEDVPYAEELLVSPDYFRTMGVSLREGRAFSRADHADAPLVAIVNEELARRFFPEGSAIGQRLQLGNPDPEVPTNEIVGVVANVKYQGLDGGAEPTVYVPFAQNAWWRTMYLVVRTTAAPLELVPRVRAEVAAVDPNIPLQEVSTIDALIRDSVGEPRIRTRLLVGFAAIALLLAMTGVYGVMAFVISQRLREMSIRMALGARPAAVMRLVIGGGLRIAVVGAAIGIVGAVAFGRVLERFVFGIGTTDLPTLAIGTAVLLLAAVGATLGPALVAARAQPASALRAS